MTAKLPYVLCVLALTVACSGGGGDDSDDAVTTDESNGASMEMQEQDAMFEIVRATCANPQYPAQSTSAYILPYGVGQAFNVGQGNCTDGSHSDDQGFAYDFDMGIGTPLVAARGGVVSVVVEQFTDGNRDPNGTNYLIIQHSDGTISGYYHLTQNGVLVDEGETVSQGQMIALSGDTGDSSQPHLHFEVAECEDCMTLPTTFRNTRANPSGLLEGQSYTAENF